MVLPAHLSPFMECPLCHGPLEGHASLQVTQCFIPINGHVLVLGEASDTGLKHVGSALRSPQGDLKVVFSFIAPCMHV